MALAKKREARLKNGPRVYDSYNACALWKRLDIPEPAPPENPLFPEQGFDDDAIDLAKRGRMSTQKSTDTTPEKAHAQWMSYVMLERKENGPNASSDPLTCGYQEAVRAYMERRGNVQRQDNAMWEAYLAEGWKPQGKKERGEGKYFQFPARTGKAEEGRDADQPGQNEEDKEDEPGSEQVRDTRMPARTGVRTAGCWAGGWVGGGSVIKPLVRTGVRTARAYR